MVDDDRGKSLEFFLGNAFPQLAGEGEVADVDVNACLVEHLHNEIFVHRGVAAVSVEVARSEFYCLAQHHAHGDIFDIEFISDGQGLADVIAIFHKGLLWQVGVLSFYKALALAATVDDHAVAARCLGDLHALADARHKRLLAKGLDDARHADNADTALNAQSWVEGAACNLGTSWHADGNAHVFLDVVAHHLPRGLVDGRLALWKVKARHGKLADALTAQYLEMVARLDACPNLNAIGHIGIIA